MFRNTKKSELSDKNFGAGSRIEIGGHMQWLVVALPHAVGEAVRRLNLSTFELEGPVVSVTDPNFLTQQEVAALVDDLHLTWSDFTFNPKGLK